MGDVRALHCRRAAGAWVRERSENERQRQRALGKTVDTKRVEEKRKFETLDLDSAGGAITADVLTSVTNNLWCGNGVFVPPS